MHMVGVPPCLHIFKTFLMQVVEVDSINCPHRSKRDFSAQNETLARHKRLEGIANWKTKKLGIGHLHNKAGTLASHV